MLLIIAIILIAGFGLSPAWAWVAFALFFWLLSACYGDGKRIAANKVNAGIRNLSAPIPPSMVRDPHAATPHLDHL